MIIIGLCGGSGSGKGTVAEAFRLYGISSIDADAVYRDLTTPGAPLVDALAAEFGSGVIATDGSLDRKALSAIVFTTDDHEKLNTLNKMTHMAILAETEKRISELQRNGEKAVIFDAPLLFESGFNKRCDVIIAVIADRQKRIDRIVNRDCITREAAEARISSQLSDDFLASHADYVIVNNGETCELDLLVKEIAEKISIRG